MCSESTKLSRAAREAIVREQRHDGLRREHGVTGVFHGDLADQLIVATARLLGAPVVTGDRKIRDYAHVATVRADGQRCSAPVAIRAIPATTVPITEPVTRFQNIHGVPQPGVASAMTVTGNIAITPHSGPRRNHLPGQEVMPTRKPISSRAL